MNNYNSDSHSQPRYDDKCYLIYGIPETMFLIERECTCQTVIDPTNNPQSKTKEVMCALGFILILIFGATWQLYRSLNTSPQGPQVTHAKQLSKTFIPESHLYCNFQR